MGRCSYVHLDWRAKQREFAAMGRDGLSPECLRFNLGFHLARRSALSAWCLDQLGGLAAAW